MTDQSLPTSNTGSIVARLRAAAVGDRLALAIIHGAPEYTGIAEDAADEIERAYQFRLCVELWLKNWRSYLSAGGENELRQLLAAFGPETIPQHSSMDYGGGPFDKDGNEGPNETPGDSGG